jgi:hypothetical protein
LRSESSREQLVARIAISRPSSDMDLCASSHQYITRKHHIVFPTVEAADPAIWTLIYGKALPIALPPSRSFPVSRLELSVAT